MSLISIFMIMCDIEHPFMHLLAICMSFLEKIYIQVLCSFFKFFINLFILIGG